MDDKAPRDSGRPIRLGGRAVHEVLLTDVPALAAATVAGLAPGLTTHENLPAEHLLSDTTAEAVTTIRAFAEALRTGVLPEPEDLAALATSAGLRAEEGVPLADILASYHLGCQTALDVLAQGLRPDDLADYQGVTAFLVAFLARVSAAVSDGYLRAYHAALGEARSAEQAMLDALLEGREGSAVAVRLGLPLEDSYVVIAMVVGTHPDERTAGVDATVAGRRKATRLRAELHRLVPGALAAVTPERATVLLPAQPGGAVAGPPLTVVVEELSRVAGVTVLAAAGVAAPADVPAAADLVTELLVVAQRAGRRSGVVGLDDLLVEFQLSRPSAATPRLARLLGPLEDHPDKLVTLRAFFAHDLNRRRTAAHLHVHPNTVDYRLRGVAALVGLDPTKPADALRLLAALSAHAD